MGGQSKPESENTWATLSAYDFRIIEDPDNIKPTAIHIWAHDRETKPCLIRVEDFPASCYLVLPECDPKGRVIEWDEDMVQAIVNYVEWKLCDKRRGKGHKILHWSWERDENGPTRKLFYYGVPGELIYFEFDHLKAVRDLAYACNYPWKVRDLDFEVKVEIAEDNIPHLNKFLAAIDFEINGADGKPLMRPDGEVQTESMQPTQWFQIPDLPGNLRDPDRPPSCRLVEESQKISIESVTEYVVRYIDIVPIPLEVTTSWVTCPKIAAFDIETYSDRKLCLPRKNNPAHSAYLYSVICQKLRDLSSRKRYAIVIGDCDQIPPEKLANTEVISIPYQKNYRRGKAELEAIERFAQIIRDYDPDIITGYNIFGYDYPYIDARLSIFGADFWPRMSRLKKSKNEVGKLKEVNWKSNAYGKQDYQYLDLEGRLSIDLFPVIKREHKLNKYDLSTVSKHFLRKDKIDIKAKEMFEIYEQLRAENVRWQETKAALAKLLPEHDPNEFEHMTEEQLKYHQEVGAEFLKCWKLAKEDHQRIKAEILRVIEYCIRDSELVVDLFERLNIWTSLREMSNITRVSIVDVFTHGQQLRCVAQLYNLARREGFVVNKRNAPAFKFNGGFVFEVRPGVYRLVICLDFASLYPNIIRAYNICHTTLIPPEWLHLTDEHGQPLYGEHNCHVIEFEQEEFVTEDVSEEKEILREIKGGSKPKSVKTGRKLKYKFLWDKTREGILPRLVRELIDARKKVNAIIARYKVQLEEFLEPLYKSADKAMPPQQVLERLRVFISEMEANNKPENKTYKQVQYQIGCLKFLVADLENIYIFQNFNLTVIINYINDNVGVLNARQLAIKVSANSFFGLLGVQQNGKLPLIEGAMCITAMGRWLNAQVQKFIEEKYGAKEIYADTDSNMIDMSMVVKERKDCVTWGLRLAEEINGIKKGEFSEWRQEYATEDVPGLFIPPLRIEFEKAMDIICYTKKRYSALLIDGKTGEYVRNKDGELLIMDKGNIIARRGNPDWLRKTFEKVRNCSLINNEPLDKALRYLIDAFKEIYTLPLQQLRFIRELGANYKQANFFLKIFSDRLSEMGKPQRAGDRLEFVVMKVLGATKLGQKLFLLEDMLEDPRDPITGQKLEIDYEYYINRVLMAPLTQVFQVCYGTELHKLEKRFHIQKTNRHKPVTIYNTVKYFSICHELGVDLELVYQQVLHALHPELPKTRRVVKDAVSPKPTESAQKTTESQTRARKIRDCPPTKSSQQARSNSEKLKQRVAEPARGESKQFKGRSRVPTERQSETNSRGSSKPTFRSRVPKFE